MGSTTDEFVSATDTQFGGGTLWFGPGRYALGRAAPPLTPTQYRALGSVEFGDVVVPDNVTLAFAPGASLQPLGAAHGVIPRPVGGPAREDGCVRVELLGAIEADAGQAFVVAEGGDTVRLEVRASFFEGAFDPAVAARSGRITLTECVAHGERLFDPRAPDDVNRETRTTNGTEVVIEPATHRNTAGLLEASSVLLHEHDSQSWQMLHAWPATGDAACAASVVVNCNCAPSPGEPLAAGSDALLTQARTSFLATRDVPSIVWDGAPASGLRLTVLGGMVNGPGQVTAPPGQRPRGNGGGVLWVHSRSVPVVVAGLQARLGSAFGSDVMSLSLRRVLEPLASEGVPTIVASGTWRP